MQKSDTGREKIGGKAWKLAGKCLLLYVELTFFINRLYMKRPQIVERIREALAQVAPEAQAILYGSEARGDARPDSDIDLLVLVGSDKLSISEEERIIAPLYDIEIETGVAINARVLLKKLWENRPFRTPFFVNVMREGIVL